MDQVAMHDGSVSVSDAKGALPHAATPQWQSFELRMRHRRADRCTRRAELALQAGALDDAWEAIEEARRMNPSGAGVADVVRRIASLKATNDSRLKRRAKRQISVAWIALLGAGIFGQVSGDGGPRFELSSRELVDALPAAERPAPIRPHVTAPALPPPAVTADPADPASSRVESVAAGATLRRQVEFADPGIALLKPSPAPLARGPMDAPAKIAGSSVLDSAPAAETGMPRRELSDAPSVAPAPGFTAPATLTSLLPAMPPAASAEARSAPRPAESVPPPIDQRTAIRATLSRYEAAYSQLDVPAVLAVWPALDSRGLARAFDGLASQRVSLGSCEVDVNAGTARANCTGTAAWTPKVGGGQRTAARSWVFELMQGDGGWHIVRVAAR